MNRPHKVFLLAVIPMCLVLGACDSGKKEKQTTNSLDKTIEVATASAIAAPAIDLAVARSRHTATLLPSGEVLFAGGASEDTSASVEVFDPKTNIFDVPGELDPVTKGGTVTQMSDGKLLFVGGKIDEKTVNDLVKLYDSKTGKFASTGSPISKRFDHTATLLANGMLLIVGGTGSDGYPLKNAELYDPNSSTFKPVGMLAVGRSRTSATLLPNGRVLITGGVDKDGVTLSSAEIFDPVTGEFSTAASLLSPRHSHSTILLSNGKTLIVGGLSGSSSPDTHAYPPSAELFDPISGRFNSTGSLQFKRHSNSTTLLPSGKVLILGGRDSSNAALGSAELYDPKSEKFSTIKSSGLASRFDHSATLLPDGTVLIAGGKVSLPKDAEAEPGIDMSGEDSNSAEIFDPKSGKTIATASLSVARVGHTAIPLSSGNVLMVGGAPMSLPDSPSNNAKRSELYTPSTGKFTSSGTFPASTFGHTATLLANGEVLLVGGFTPSGPSSATTLYTSATRAFSSSGKLNVGRYEHTATPLPDGRILFVGGQMADGESDRNVAELYDPRTGIFTKTGKTSYARVVGHTATLLPTGKVLIAGGGSASAELYDPSTGTFAVTGSLSAVRYRPTATLLPNGTVLVAGGVGDYPLDSADIYDPGTGIFSATGHLVNGRFGHSAAQLGNGKVLLLGGQDRESPYDTVTASCEFYDLRTGSFSPSSSLPLPSFGATATVLPSGNLLIAGGQDKNTRTKSAFIYDQNNGTFGTIGDKLGSASDAQLASTVMVPAQMSAESAPISEMPVDAKTLHAGLFQAAGGLMAPRFLHTATLLANGKVLLAGGGAELGLKSGGQHSAEMYDPADGRFSAVGKLAHGRFGHTATLLESGRVLIAGGFGSGPARIVNSLQERSRVAEAELFDHLTGVFNSSGKLVVPRTIHTATLLKNGKVLVVGGQNNGVVLSHAEVYDPTSSAFSETGRLANERQFHTATLLQSGEVLIVGGMGAGGIPIASAELYDPRSGKFRTTGSLVTVRSGHTATLLPNGNVLVVGGSGQPKGGVSGPHRGAELYDAVNGTFSIVSENLPGRREHTATLLADGRVLVAGEVQSATLYDPLARRFSTTANMTTSSRVDHSATLLPNGMVLFAGGATTVPGSGTAEVSSNSELFDPGVGALNSRRHRCCD